MKFDGIPLTVTELVSVCCSQLTLVGSITGNIVLCATTGVLVQAQWAGYCCRTIVHISYDDEGPDYIFYCILSNAVMRLTYSRQYLDKC